MILLTFTKKKLNEKKATSNKCFSKKIKKFQYNI